MAGRPLLADSRSPASSSERQLLRKLPLNLDESAAISDPLETPIKKPPQMRWLYICQVDWNNLW